jgi:predicted transposase/invertase (TIGR01784 family)
MFDTVTSDPKLRELIRMRETGLHDYNSDIGSAKREGIAEGSLEKAKETALAMLADKMPIASISKYTDLGIDEIEKIMLGGN